MSVSREELALFVNCLKKQNEEIELLKKQVEDLRRTLECFVPTSGFLKKPPPPLVMTGLEDLKKSLEITVPEPPKKQDEVESLKRQIEALASAMKPVPDEVPPEEPTLEDLKKQNRELLKTLKKRQPEPVPNPEFVLGEFTKEEPTPDDLKKNKKLKETLKKRQNKPSSELESVRSHNEAMERLIDKQNSLIRAKNNLEAAKKQYEDNPSREGQILLWTTKEAVRNAKQALKRAQINYDVVQNPELAGPSQEETKPKRKAIPKTVKNLIWNKWIGATVAKANCPICNENLMDKNGSGWHCSHIIASAEGGTDDAVNLRPICSTCNMSMGTTSMLAYVKKVSPDYGQVIQRLQLV